MPTTSNTINGWRLPLGGDDPDVVDDLTQLTLGIERRVISVFASASARNTAVAGKVEEGMFAFLKDTNTLTYYDGAAWQTFKQGTHIIGSGSSVPTNADPGYSNGDVFFKI